MRRRRRRRTARMPRTRSRAPARRLTPDPPDPPGARMRRGGADVHRQLPRRPRPARGGRRWRPRPRSAPPTPLPRPRVCPPIRWNDASGPHHYTGQPPGAYGLCERGGGGKVHGAAHPKNRASQNARKVPQVTGRHVVEIEPNRVQLREAACPPTPPLRPYRAGPAAAGPSRHPEQPPGQGHRRDTAEQGRHGAHGTDPIHRHDREDPGGLSHHGDRHGRGNRMASLRVVVCWPVGFQR